MKETRLVIVVVSIFVALGLIVLYFSVILSPAFNFYKTELTIDGATINEKLYFEPDKDYHSLFRTFDSPIYSQGKSYNLNSVEIKDVGCKTGQAYFKDSYNNLFRFPESENRRDIPYTEKNEYGCTFGKDIGFKDGENYWIKSTYELHPDNLFLINNNYYIIIMLLI